MTEVWIAETGDYEQRHVTGVYASVEAAVECTKADYAPPYRVTWHPIEDRLDGAVYLTGDFEAVDHYSTRHTGVWEFSRYDVQDVPAVRSSAGERLTWYA